MSKESVEPEVSGTPEGDELDRLLEHDKATTEWMKQQCSAEIESFKPKRINLIPLKVRNTSILQGKPLVNRVEFNTGFDFEKVTQILTGKPQPCPTKKGFVYINVILMVDGLSPFIFPYLFKDDPKNALTHWLFINNKLERAQHVVDSFTQL
ncbi:uncharacterized protein MONOS_4831 [Monocercomonoides exilis]|uniref:uncharacterized protein n=1 Tax=Monocercomonoides exilis TaxID=2049356 RepID=UPI00355A4B24|nr:hypothetical protein MONOS_4831 [Monocercomonoides exilis]|eukprot:MONOS_4831.1-p1 / transcript=MONOS_4831.1 / gene=MONOS_4831 / organism=Monocercomonoides_exilis_PA203 / gene_product=unspecified product / transcript_product=unspecified product / location=Mono_scaffold00134:65484-66081(+) / protein_length=152 / sequence_SO=supercontig / SO=protein_coding / is_pseudo=false